MDYSYYFNYVLLLAGSLFFSIQFGFGKYYQRKCGTSLYATFLHVACYNAVGFAILFCLNGFRMNFTPFTAFFGILAGLDAIGYLFCSLQAFSRTNLSVYSLFSALGNLVLPSLTGLLFFREELTVGKILCFALVAAALLLNVKKGEGKSGFVWYAGVFVMSGMSGVLSKLHNSLPGVRADAASFAMMNALVAGTVGTAALLIVALRQTPEEKAERPKITPGAFGSIVAYGALNKLGIYLLLIALTVLPATSQYPFVTGGNLIFPVLISVIMKEKPGPRALLAVLLSFLGIAALLLL